MAVHILAKKRRRSRVSSRHRREKKADTIVAEENQVKEVVREGRLRHGFRSPATSQASKASSTFITPATIR